VLTETISKMGDMRGAYFMKSFDPTGISS